MTEMQKPCECGARIPVQMESNPKKMLSIQNMFRFRFSFVHELLEISS